MCEQARPLEPEFLYLGVTKMENKICPGFKAAGLASGVKKNGEKDLGIIYSEVTANAAGVFTTNRVQAACVGFNRERLRSGKCQAVIVNSGNANCCNGERGLTDVFKMAESAGKALGISEEFVLVASTGVIGESLPIEKIETASPQLITALTSSGMQDFAEAILTTDTVPKQVTRKGRIDGKDFTVTGVAKGSGMIRPNMATLLSFICTDIEAGPETLQTLLSASVDRSFNRITIDGDTSTNDMVLILANGMSGAVVEGQAQISAFQAVLDSVLYDLARMIVKDGEGATKLVEIVVNGAASDADARLAAETIANSSLVKTALFGEDANWGRIIAAAGRAGVALDPDGIDIFFNSICMARKSQGCGKAVEAEVSEVLKKSEYAITVDLGMGAGRASALTCDFSIDYVKINADYRS